MLNIGIVVFPGVEELDFIAPYEVLSYTNKIMPDSVKVSLIAQDMQQIQAFNGLRFCPDATWQDTDKLDILIVPGGKGRLTQMYNPLLLDFIRRLYPSLQQLTSVCTGAFILAQTGLLNGRNATTYYSVLDELAGYRDINVLAKQKVVQDGNIITAAGVSSGLELGFYIIKMQFGEDMMHKVAEAIEYIPQL